MSMLTVILEPDADGILHLPVPKELRSGRVKVTATLESAEALPPATGAPAARPDFAAIRRKIFGPDATARQLSREDSSFIRDRGDW